MIKYALQCAAGHRFEGWFANMADYDGQAAAGALRCPVCDSASVEKALMAPNLATGRARDAAADEKLAAFKRGLNDAARKVRDHVHANAEGVGRAFPEEARKIHYGEAEDRPIYGEATPKEAAELAEEGVAIAPVPQPDDEIGAAPEAVN